MVEKLAEERHSSRMARIVSVHKIECRIEETTAVYRADPKRDGPHAWVLGQSVEAIFERARRIGVPLPTAFIFAVYIQACS
jgi:hypothetical protein